MRALERMSSNEVLNRGKLSMFWEQVKEKVSTSYKWLKEIIPLIAVQLRFEIFNFWENLKIVSKYYLGSSFYKADLALLFQSFFHDPYKMSKLFLLEKGSHDVYLYGETPLTTLDHITSVCQVNAKDVVFEIGAGRGRTCFWLALYKGCHVVAIEQIPGFVQDGERITKGLEISNLEWRCQNFLEADFKGATVLYVCGTNFDEKTISKLAEKCTRLPSGTKIITISYPLTTYTSQNAFEVMKRFSARFSWGAVDVYLQVRR